MRIYFVILIVLLSGCSVRYAMHENENYTDDDLALVYDPRAYLTIYSIDGRAADYTMAKVVEVPPGEHRFILSWNSSFRPPVLIAAPLFKPDGGDPYVDLTLDLKAGYSYTFGAKLNGKPAWKGEPDEACFYGEPSDAPGSSVNVTGEYRMHSENVSEIICANFKR